VSPDGQYVVSASWDRTLKVWELATGKELRTLSGHINIVSGVTVSPDGQYVVSASNDNTLKVWELATGNELYTLSGHIASVNGVTVSPDGQYVVSASNDNTLKVWELATGRVVMSFTGEGAFDYCAIAPDGRTVIAGDSGGQLYFLRMEGLEFSQ
jgi:WD40 repeat protein